MCEVAMERRNEPRNRCDLSATIRVLACGRRLSGRILDLSSEGMAVLSPEPLQPDAAVAVIYKGVLIIAEVVHCSSSPDGYRLGVKVDQALATSDVTVAEAETEIRSVVSARSAEQLSVQAMYVARA